MSRQRINLSSGFHAEPGDTAGHQHDVYTTFDVPKGSRRVHVGTLTKAAVDAWAKSARSVQSTKRDGA